LDTPVDALLLLKYIVAQTRGQYIWMKRKGISRYF